MKVIIAGTRTIDDYNILLKAIKLAKKEKWKITRVVCGCADGPDTLGEYWARAKGIPLKRFRPKWKLYGKSAGPRRNKRMALYADAALIIWDGKSKGTKNMIELAEKYDLKLIVYYPYGKPSSKSLKKKSYRPPKKYYRTLW